MNSFFPIQQQEHISKMGSLSDLKLPCIDLSEATEPDTIAWEDARDKVRKAVSQFGCFEARFDGVPLELRKKVVGTMEEMFKLPLETKQRFVSTKPFPPYGYIGQSPSMPLIESVGIDDADEMEKVEEMAQTLWPEGNPSVSQNLHSYTEKISSLDKIIRSLILDGLGVKQYIPEHLDSTNYLFLLMKYTGPDTMDAKIGLDAHTDKSVLTILHQNQVAGLEVQTKDGEWINFKPSPESFVVIVGDSLYALLNGGVHPAYHRVMMTGTETRYSFGLFSVPKPEYVIRALPELVDDEHPALFKPFDHNQFMRFLYSEEGQKVENADALKVYCGA